MINDFRLALRSVVKRPGLSLPIVITLALGIGANTAVFSIVYSLLLKPFPFPEPDRVVRVFDTQPSFDTAPAAQFEYADWRDQNRVFAEIGAVTPSPMTVAGTADPQLVIGGSATASALRVFSAAPILGRWFTEEEDRPGGANVAILFERLWTRRFGRDSALIGRTVTIDGVPRTVVGIMPDAPLEALLRFDVLVPLARPVNRQDGLHSFLVFGRLKPGITLAQAHREMVALGRRLAADNRSNHGINVAAYRDSLIGGMAKVPVLMLFAVVTLVLLIACANVANLMLARANSRRREVAVRVAMGAGRLRLVRQMLAESTILALGGGALGFGVACGLVRALLAAIGAAVPRLALAIIPSITIDWRVLGFTLGVSAVTGVLFGLAPLAGQGARRVSDALKEESSRSTGSRAVRRLGSGLVVAEIALSVVLLAAAGLLVKSLLRLADQQTGIVADRVLAFDVTLPARSYATPDSIRAFHRGAIARLRTLPAVTTAAITTSLPMYNPGSNGQLDIDNRPWKQNEGPLADVRALSGNYFDALKVPLVRGRLLSDEDNERSPMVAVVNQALATKCWPDQDPIGKRVNIWGGWRQVVGVVGDVRSWGPAAKPELEVDIPTAQDTNPARAVNFVVRTSVSDPLAVAQDAQRELARLDPGLAVANVQTMADVVGRAIGPQRLLSSLVSVFAALAALLAAVGVYGLIAYTVGQRRWEFGVRMALGADRSVITRLVLARGVRLAAIGVMMGGLGALGIGQALKSMLHQVAPNDPWVLVATCAATVVVTLTACYIPARAASRVNPIETLRAL